MNVFQYHPRRFGNFRYVYPVISRRSAGLSLGVNLSPTAHCNFACVYCQVLAEESEKINRTGLVNIPQIESELRDLITAANNGSLFQGTWLSETPPEKRVLKDIAFSGDGEPTLAPQFAEAVQKVIELRRELCEVSVKIVVITNASTLQVPSVQQTLGELFRHNGEVWAKLDAGTPEYYQQVSRSSVPFEKILSNLKTFSQTEPVVIQTCFLNLYGQPPKDEEIRHYADRLRELKHIKHVQLYTTARNVPEPWVKPLSNEQLDSIADEVQRLTEMEVRRYYAGSEKK
ncbi:hypothetical protein FACS189419_06410 [Planctomycetales bacterium]|nr:hypothetical protein FACS189419_06410 [Planctomycetales bacterium]